MAQRDNVDMVAKLRYMEGYCATRAGGGSSSASGVVIRVDGAGVIQARHKPYYRDLISEGKSYKLYWLL